MKSIALSLLAILALGLPAVAAEKEKPKPGPNGGRVVRNVEPPLEVYITKDRKIEITALTKDLKPAKLTGQVISVTAGDRSNPTRLELKEDGGRLVSTNALPKGEDYPVSVSIKQNAGAKAVYDKFHLDLSECSGCKLPEYACTCAHADESETKKK
jgi:hypothetical protein